VRQRNIKNGFPPIEKEDVKNYEVIQNYPKLFKILALHRSIPPNSSGPGSFITAGFEESVVRPPDWNPGSSSEFSSSRDSQQ